MQGVYWSECWWEIRGEDCNRSKLPEILQTLLQVWYMLGRQSFSLRCGSEKSQQAPVGVQAQSLLEEESSTGQNWLGLISPPCSPFGWGLPGKSVSAGKCCVLSRRQVEGVSKVNLQLIIPFCDGRARQCTFTLSLFHTFGSHSLSPRIYYPFPLFDPKMIFWLFLTILFLLISIMADLSLKLPPLSCSNIICFYLFSRDSCSVWRTKSRPYVPNPDTVLCFSSYWSPTSSSVIWA